MFDSGTEDTELIARAQEGDRMAFEELVCRYDEQVLRLAWHFTRNREDAKDVYQEVFMRVFRSLRSFRFQSSFSTWLYRIAVNTCLSFQSRNRDNSISVDGWPESQASRRNVFETTARPADGYWKTMGSEIAAGIERALDELSPQQRLIFVLRHFQDLKIKEIGSLLDCSQGTVKKHLFVAAQKMRERLRAFVNLK